MYGMIYSHWLVNVITFYLFRHYNNHKCPVEDIYAEWGHLVNLVDVACRHQWMVTDNAVQSTVHNLCANIQCHSHLHDHCFSDHGRSWQCTSGTRELCACALSLFWYHLIVMILSKTNLCREPCSEHWSHSSSLILSRKAQPLPTPITRLWWDQYGPQLIVELLPHIVCAPSWAINISVVMWLLL